MIENLRRHVAQALEGLVGVGLVGDSQVRVRMRVVTVLHKVPLQQSEVEEISLCTHGVPMTHRGVPAAWGTFSG